MEIPKAQEPVETSVSEAQLPSAARRRLLLGGSAAGIAGMAPVAVEAQQGSDVVKMRA